jgi:hypothetical protein
MIPFFTAGYKSGGFNPLTDDDVSFYLDFEDSWTLNNTVRDISTGFIFTNSSGNPYETYSYNSATKTITAANTTGGGVIFHAAGSFVDSSDLMVVKCTLILNSGTAPFLRVNVNTGALGGTLHTNSVQLSNGFNEITLTPTVFNTTGFLQIFTANGVSNNFTLEIHSISRVKWVGGLKDSRNNGITVFSSVPDSGTPCFWHYFDNKLIFPLGVANRAGINVPQSQGNYIFTVVAPYDNDTTLRGFRDDSGIFLQHENGSFPTALWTSKPNPQAINQYVGIQSTLRTDSYFQIGSTFGHNTLRGDFKNLIALKGTASSLKIQQVRDYLVSRYNL